MFIFSSWINFRLGYFISEKFHWRKLSKIEDKTMALLSEGFSSIGARVWRDTGPVRFAFSRERSTYLNVKDFVYFFFTF